MKANLPGVEIDLATEGALCERYDITLVSRESDRREQLGTVRDDGVSALHGDEDVPDRELGEYTAANDAASDESDGESEPEAGEVEDTDTEGAADAGVEESAGSDTPADTAGDDTSSTSPTTECEESEPAATPAWTRSQMRQRILPTAHAVRCRRRSNRSRRRSQK